MLKKTKEQILKELGKLPESVYDELVNDFITLAESKKEEFERLIEADDYDELMKLAHFVRGAATNLRLEEIGEILAAMEFKSKSRKDKEEIARYLLALGEKVKYLQTEFLKKPV